MSDLDWLAGITTGRDSRLIALQQALAEYGGQAPKEYIRDVEIDGKRYVIVGTWTGTRRGKRATVFGAPGRERSFMRSDLVDLDLSSEDGSCRVWLLPYRLQMPLRIWVHADGMDQAVRYYILEPDGPQQVDRSAYERARENCR